jgi:hypothetical protein
MLLPSLLILDETPADREYPDWALGKPGRQANCSKEFDADHFSHLPDNYASVPDALRVAQKRKLRRNLERVDHLQRSSSLGLIPDNTGNYAPVVLNTSRLQTAFIQSGIYSTPWHGRTQRTNFSN